MEKEKILFAGMIGSMLEFYDFTLFGLLLPIMAPLFFPSSDPLTSLLASYLVFAVGFFSYPLGALLFGYIGDRYGRKKALVLSITLMSIPTAFIGLLPTYAQVGIFASVLLFICRFIQGICAGGEYNGSAIFVIEHADFHKRGFWGSLVAASGTFGALLAALAVTLVIPLAPWAWRIPFLAGILIGVTGFYIRKKVGETPEFQNVSSSFNQKIPLFEVFKHHPIAALCAIGCSALGTVPFYLVIGFFNTYFVMVERFTQSTSIHLNTACLLFCVTTMPLAGYLADKIGYRRLMYFSAFTTICFSVPFFTFMQSSSVTIILSAELFLLGLSQCFVAPLNAFLATLFPANIRCSGITLGYCLGMAIFGGTTPYIMTSLFQWESIFILSLYLSFIAFMGLAAVWLSRKFCSSGDSYETNNLNTVTQLA